MSKYRDLADRIDALDPAPHPDELLAHAAACALVLPPECPQPVMHLLRVAIAGGYRAGASFADFRQAMDVRPDLGDEPPPIDPVFAGLLAQIGEHLHHRFE